MSVEEYRERASRYQKEQEMKQKEEELKEYETVEKQRERLAEDDLTYEERTVERAITPPAPDDLTRYEERTVGRASTPPTPDDLTRYEERTIGREDIKIETTPYRPGGLPKPGSIGEQAQASLKPVYEQVGSAVSYWDKLFVSARESIFGGASDWGKKAEELKLSGKDVEAGLYKTGQLFTTFGVGLFEGATYMFRPEQWRKTIEGVANLVKDPYKTFESSSKAFLTDPLNAIMYGSGTILGATGAGYAVGRTSQAVINKIYPKNCFSRPSNFIPDNNFSAP